MRVKVERHLRRFPTKMIFEMEENARRSRKRFSHGSRPHFLFFLFLFPVLHFKANRPSTRNFWSVKERASLLRVHPNGLLRVKDNRNVYRIALPAGKWIIFKITTTSMQIYRVKTARSPIDRLNIILVSVAAEKPRSRETCRRVYSSVV